MWWKWAKGFAHKMTMVSRIQVGSCMQQASRPAHRIASSGCLQLDWCFPSWCCRSLCRRGLHFNLYLATLTGFVKSLPMAVAIPFAYLSIKFLANRSCLDHGPHCRITTASFATLPVALWSVLGAVIVFGVILCVLPRSLLWWPDVPVEVSSKEDLLNWVRKQFLSVVTAS